MVFSMYIRSFLFILIAALIVDPASRLAHGQKAPGRQGTFALTNATMRFVLALADKGVKRALAEDPHLMNGLNVHQGQVTYKAVADNLGYDFVAPQQALGF